MHKHTHIHSHTQSYCYTHDTHTCKHTCYYTHAHAHAHIYTHIHTFKHIYTLTKRAHGVKRDLLQRQKRPNIVSKETYYSVKREILYIGETDIHTHKVRARARARSLTKRDLA
jgi:hypothetical protein